jgi:hypothetical protein
MRRRGVAADVNSGAFRQLIKTFQARLNKRDFSRTAVLQNPIR